MTFRFLIYNTMCLLINQACTTFDYSLVLTYLVCIFVFLISIFYTVFYTYSYFLKCDRLCIVHINVKISIKYFIFLYTL